MCGRTACTLAPDEICKACSSLHKEGTTKVYKSPQWRDHPGDHNYYPSTNLAPSRFSPVIVRDHEENFKDEYDAKSYFIQPMMWGLIPSFYKGESAAGYKYNTSNCRIEDIMTRSSYKPSLSKGQRCVILCDGFYEWQTTKGTKNKQPYFIHAPQFDGIEIWNKDSWISKDVWTENEGWKGPQLLKMAGLYSHWISLKGEEIFTYTVLTMEAGKSFSWLHNRIPAILETDADAEAWLDGSNMDYKSLLSQFSNNPKVMTYPVSTIVNNSRNHDTTCMVPISLEDKKKPSSGSSKLMSAWLNSSSSSSSKKSPPPAPSSEEPKTKKQKGIKKE